MRDNWLIKRIGWYVSAFKVAWQDNSFRIGVITTTIGIAIALVVGIGMTRLVVLVATALLGWALEMMNSGMECLVDSLYGKATSHIVKRVKDSFGAAPAFVFSAYWVCWLILVAPTLWERLI